MYEVRYLNSEMYVSKCFSEVLYKNASDIQIDDDSMYYTKDKYFLISYSQFFFIILCVGEWVYTRVKS